MAELFKKRISLKYRILLAAVIILLPVTTMFYYFNSEAILQMDKQLATANFNTLDIFCRSVETKMTETESSLLMVWNEENGLNLFGSADTDEEIQEAGEILLQKLGDLFNSSGTLTALVAYSKGTGAYMPSFNPLSNLSQEDRSSLSEVVAIMAHDEPLRQGWYVQEVNGKWYWMRMITRNDVFLFGMIDISRLSKTAQTESALSTPIVFLKSKKPITSAVWLEENKDIPEISEAGYAFTGKDNRYMLVERSIVGLNALYAVPYRDNMGAVGWLRAGSMFFLTAVGVAVALSWTYLKKSFFRPLGDLVDTMQKIQDGDLEARSGSFTSKEFSQVNETFNSMIGEIQTLRIESYENRIAAQEAQMDALRMQIRPHFYLNSLKSIYGLAQLGKMSDIQKSILLLSNHLRYAFYLSTDVVTLEKELQQCVNYVELQYHGQEIKPVFTITVDPLLKQLEVPPISLLTIVENITKYGIMPDRRLMLEIRTDILKTDVVNLANISIRDNGPGFPEEALPRLNRILEHSAEDGHIGLNNMARRFRFLYGEGFAVTFGNKDGGVVELFIPLK
jgi:two-component system sensor histidine kinase YesM